MNDSEYFSVRFSEDKKRSILWRTLVDSFFSKFVTEKSSVLELGCGYCDFINNIKCEKKIGIDLSPDSAKYAKNNVKFFQKSVTELDFLVDDDFDLIFSSNLFEHLDRTEISDALKILHKKIKKTGKIIFLQPNYRFAYANYFDDYTHKSIWSDISFVDFLIIHHFKVQEIYPKFLPLSIKSRLPTFTFLIKLYLMLPIKPFGKQMLIIASKEHE